MSMSDGYPGHVDTHDVVRLEFHNVLIFKKAQSCRLSQFKTVMVGWFRNERL